MRLYIDIFKGCLLVLLQNLMMLPIGLKQKLKMLIYFQKKIEYLKLEELQKQELVLVLDNRIIGMLNPYMLKKTLFLKF